MIKNRKKIVIIGGGYAGISLIYRLKKEFNITLIDETKAHVEQTEIHRYLGDKISLDELIYPYNSFINDHLVFINAHAKLIDFKNNRVLYDDNFVEYDYLIISTGSKTMFPKQIKNIDQCSKDIKNIETIKNFKNEFELLLNSDIISKEIVIAGAGLSGVEIAIELALKAKKDNPSAKINITIVEKEPNILPGSHKYLIKKTEKALDNLNIKSIHGEFIVAIKENKIVLSNKKELDFNLSLFLLGVVSEELKNEQNIELNIKNQYIVNDYFQIENFKNAFCLGDMAQTLTPKGDYNLPTAQMATAQAELLSKNIIRLERDELLVKNTLELNGVMIDIGDKSAVCMIYGFKFSGIFAYWLKRVTSFIHKKRLKKCSS